MRKPESKLIDTPERLTGFASHHKYQRGGLVVTNGCFDILHVGHLNFLTECRDKGNTLLVGVNSDESVRALKGDGRPINTAKDRAILLAGLEVVDFVYIFNETTAEKFLDLARPDIWAKSGYTMETLNAGEVEVVKNHKGAIHLLHFNEGYSTTGIIAKIKK